MSDIDSAAEIQNIESLSLADLQPELLEHILEYLPWSDIQECRCVSRTWYYNCTLKKFTNKLFIRFSKGSFTRSSDIMKWYLQNKETYANVFFEDVDFSLIDFDEYRDLWSEIGPYIEYLKIKDCGFPLERLKFIFPHLLNISTLVINGIHSVLKNPEQEEGYESYLNFEDFEPNTLGEIPIQFKKLKCFIYNYNLVLSDRMFDSLTKMMPNIEILRIKRQCETPPEDLDISWSQLFEFIKQQSAKLKSLAIHGWAVKQESILDLASLKDLKLVELDISVNYYHADNDTILSEFLIKQNQLKTLRLHSWAVSNSNFEVICDFLKDLETLSIESYTMTDAVIPNLAKLKKIKNLSLNRQEFQYDSLMRGILYPGNTALVNLDLIPSGCPKTFFENIYQIKNLRVLKIYNCECLITDREINLLAKHMQQLEKLSIEFARFTDQSFLGTEDGDNAITNLTKLAELRLFKMDLVSDKSSVPISKLYNLRMLNLTGSRITNNGIQRITKGCQKLEELRISNCKNLMAPGYLAIFENLPKLKRLYCGKRQKGHMANIKLDVVSKRFRKICFYDYDRSQFAMPSIND